MMGKAKTYFNGWFISYNVRKIHFYIDGVSLCKKWEYKSHRASEINIIDNKSNKFCKKCLTKLT
jgi:hypothetical protein